MKLFNILNKIEQSKKFTCQFCEMADEKNDFLSFAKKTPSIYIKTREVPTSPWQRQKNDFFLRWIF